MNRLWWWCCCLFVVFAFIQLSREQPPEFLPPNPYHYPVYNHDDFDFDVFHTRTWRSSAEELKKLSSFDRQVLKTLKSFEDPEQLMLFTRPSEVKSLSVKTPYRKGNIASGMKVPVAGAEQCESATKTVERTFAIRERYLEIYKNQTHAIEFYYSISNRSVDNIDLEPQGQKVSAPKTGTYTRFLFNLWFKMNSTISEYVLPKELDYSNTFLMVASGDLADPQPCSTAISRCPDTEICTSISPTTISIKLRNVKAVYQLEKYCPYPQQCQAGFAYFSVDSYNNGLHSSCGNMQPDTSGTCDYQNACTTSFDPSSTTSTCTNNMFCNQETINQQALAGFGNDQSQLDQAIQSYCGARSDPIGGFSQSLNQDCTTACCAAICSSDNPIDHWHQRWVIAPEVSMYQVQSLQKISADLEVNVTVQTGDPNNPTEVRTVVLENIDVGKYALDTEGTNEVRVSVQNIYSPLYNALPTLTGGLLVYWGGNKNNIANQPGIMPTIDSSGYGWAFIRNGSFSWGNAPGLYGVSQPEVTGSAGKGVAFGSSPVCNLNSDKPQYYREYKDLPGWDTRRLSGPAVCQWSHEMNSLGDWILDSSPSTALPDSYIGWQAFPPHYDFCSNNYEFDVDNQLLIYTIPTNEPPQGTAPVTRDRCRAVNTAAGTMDFGAAASRANQQNSTLQVFTIAVDSSTDLTEYRPSSQSIEFSAGNNYCMFSYKNSTGKLGFTVTNTNPQYENKLNVEILCRDQFDPGSTDVVVWDTSKTGPLTMTVPASSSTSSGPQNLKSSSKVLSTDKIECTVQLFGSETEVEQRKHTIPCVNWDNLILRSGEGNPINDKSPKSSCSSWTDFSCPWVVVTWVIVTLLFIGLIVGIVYLMYLALSACAKKRKTDKLVATSTGNNELD